MPQQSAGERYKIQLQLWAGLVIWKTVYEEGMGAVPGKTIPKRESFDCLIDKSFTVWLTVVPLTPMNKAIGKLTQQWQNHYLLTGYFHQKI